MVMKWGREKRWLTLASHSAGTLFGEETQRSMAGTLKFSVRHLERLKFGDVEVDPDPDVCTLGQGQDSALLCLYWTGTLVRSS